MRHAGGTCRFRAAVVLSILVGGGSLGLRAAPGAEPDLEDVVTAPVVLDGTTLFRVRGISSLPAHERARRIAERIAAVGRDSTFYPDDLRVVEGRTGTEIFAIAQRLMVVTDADAEEERAPRAYVASLYREAIADALERFRVDRNPAALRRGLRDALVIAGSLVAFLALLVLLGRRVDAAVARRLHRHIRKVRLKSFKIINSETMWSAVRGTLRALRAVLALAACFVAAGLALQRFPWTRSAATQVLSSVLDPLRTAGRAVVGAIPDVIVLAVVVLVVRWALHATHLFFESLRIGSVKVRGFDPSWATPTYRLVRIGILALALVVAYPYIPGSSSEAFKGVSIFLGVLFSLGSSPVIASVIAGYAITYRRVFRVGDRVKIGEVIGDVDQIRVMVTRLRTIKNEEAVIPNSSIVQANVLNYSALCREQGLILYTRVGIGYEVPWRQVEGMLLLAAERTPHVRREPPPFVLHLKLGDFAVEYELNVYCDDAHAMEELYTELRRNVLDAFNEYGVQIMTPEYESDPREAKVVPRDKWYAAPARMEPAEPGRVAEPLASAATSK